MISKFKKFPTRNKITIIIGIVIVLVGVIMTISEKL